jgi:hypothetical protein
MDYRKRNTNQLYIMESATLIKIGISCDAVSRLESLNIRLPFKDRFRIVKVKFYKNHFEARNAEKSLHLKYSYANVPTDYEGAKTECFSKEIINLVLLDMESNGMTYSYDPFIYTSKKNAEKVLGYEFEYIYKEIAKRYGRRSFNSYNTSTVDLCLRNIAANLLMAEGRNMFFNIAILHLLSPSGVFMEKVLDIINLSQFGSLKPASRLSKKSIKMFNLNKPPIFLQKMRYEKVTKGYLISIESIWDENLNNYTRSRYFKELKSFCLKDVVGDTCNLTLEYEF